jgi:hypothetical protein
MLARIPFLLGVLVSGVLAQDIITPLLEQKEFFLRWAGGASGAGMSLLLVFAGISGAVVFLLGYVSRSIREVDSPLSDQI